MEAFPSLRHINRTSHATRTLRDVSLDLMSGEVHCLTGQNGCGKSTLIKIMSGVYRPDEGAEITLSGKNWSRLTSAASVAQGIQVIYQDLSLFPNLSVWENVTVNHYHHGLPVNRRRLREVAQAAMISISITLPLDTLVSELSVIRYQLVAICRALAQGTRLIVMDEPTASLTHQEVQGLLQVVHQLHERGICVVFVSHRLGEVMEVSDRISVPKDGELVGTFPTTEMTAEQLGFLIADQELEYQMWELWRGKSSTPVLEVRNLSRHGEYLNISLRVEAGEVVSIVGLLDAGHVELCLSLSGMTRPGAGEILTNGQPVALHSNQDAIRHGISYISEDRISRDLVMVQSIKGDIISTVLCRVRDRFSFLSKTRVRNLVDRLIKALTIKVSGPRLPVNTLSGGNAQRISIVKWLVIGPWLLILGSPTISVDIVDKAGIYGIIGDPAAHDITVLMICDEIKEAWYQSHRVLVMQKGQITHSFLPDGSSQARIAEVVNG